MEHYYKSHSILITTWGRMDGFTPELRINKQLAPLVFETLKINKPFPTKAELHVLASKSPKNGLTMANLSLMSMD
jgi:hypothetical protein